jgi:hypothetical protein
LFGLGGRRCALRLSHAQGIHKRCCDGESRNSISHLDLNRVPLVERTLIDTLGAEPKDATAPSGGASRKTGLFTRSI